MPELAISIAGAIKKEHDLIIGNILGSNIFNLLLVLSLTAIIRPITIRSYAIYFDFAAMFFMTVLLYFLIYFIRHKGKLNRFEGVLLFLTYVGSLIILCFLNAHFG